MHLQESQLTQFALQPAQNKEREVFSFIRTVKEALHLHLPVNELKKSFKLDSFHYEVYLEGAYANGTNINFADHPKIIVQLNSVFWADREQLSEHEQRKYSEIHNDSEYKFKIFKDDVQNALGKAFSGEKIQKTSTGLLVEYQEKTINVIPACQYRLYKKFISYEREHFLEGIKFFNTDTDAPVVYFPKLHLRNCLAKDQDTDGRFKSTIRIFKHIRNFLDAGGYFAKTKAPSYVIESLLYNCSDHCFSGSYTHSMLQSLQYLFDALLSGRIAGFISADEQEMLIGEGMWSLEDAQRFIHLVANYYLEPGKYATSQSQTV